MPCTFMRGTANFPEMYDLYQISRCPKGKVKHVPYWKPTYVKRHHPDISRPGWPGAQGLCTPAFMFF